MLLDDGIILADEIVKENDQVRGKVGEAVRRDIILGSEAGKGIFMVSRKEAVRGIVISSEDKGVDSFGQRKVLSKL